MLKSQFGGTGDFKHQERTGKVAKGRQGLSPQLFVLLVIYNIQHVAASE